VFKVKGGCWVTVEMAAGMCLGSRVGVGCACWFELVVLGGVWVMGVSPGSVRVALEGLLSRWVGVCGLHLWWVWWHQGVMEVSLG
jgi:hypothetical protein